MTAPTRKIPAFSASMTRSKTLETGEVLKFDKVWANIMNGYDPNTGVFTVPMDGIYQFSCTVMNQSGKTVYVHLWKKDRSIICR